MRAEQSCYVGRGLWVLEATLRRAGIEIIMADDMGGLRQ